MARPTLPGDPRVVLRHQRVPADETPTPAPPAAPKFGSPPGAAPLPRESERVTSPGMRRPALPLPVPVPPKATSSLVIAAVIATVVCGVIAVLAALTR